MYDELTDIMQWNGETAVPLCCNSMTSLRSLYMSHEPQFSNCMKYEKTLNIEQERPFGSMARVSTYDCIFELSWHNNLHALSSSVICVVIELIS